MLIRRLVYLWAIIPVSAFAAWAQGTASIHGQVVDQTGAAVPGASVTVTNTTTGLATGTTTDAQGRFDVTDLTTARYLVTVKQPGFQTFTQQVAVQAGQQASLQAKLELRAAVQSVQVEASAVPGATLEPSQEDVLKSAQTLRVLSRKDMDAVGPLAGAPQIMSMAPGANVAGYGATGQTKSTIVINGINQGWGGYGGYNYPGSLGVTLDGIPIVDAASGLWPSASLPQSEMFQNTNVTYGPGDPVDRYYTDIGGSIEFTPIQPASKVHLDTTLSFGSYNQKNIELNALSGLYHGWSASFSGGLGKGDDFRQGPDGFANNSKDGALYAKATKSFSTGIFDVGGYYARAGGYRAQVIPMTSVPGLTMCGLDVAGCEIYSQATSGYYSTLPYSSYNKYDVNELGMVYAKEIFLLSPSTGVQNQTWYTHERRWHVRQNDVYIAPSQMREWNDPFQNTIGDQLVVSERFRFNKLSEGGYFVHDIYDTRNNFYNPAFGGNGEKGIANIGGKIRSTYFIQDNYAGFVQDQFQPLPQLMITPGVRFDRYGTSSYSGTLQDFTFAPGALADITSHCILTGTSYTPPGVPASDLLVDQGSSCGAREARNGVEPSVSAAFFPRPWLNFYGSYAKVYRSPSLGGGGGLFQSVNPNTNYILSSAKYAQGGFKLHFSNVAGLKNVLLGAAYYHLTYANEQLSVELGNGNVINTSGSSRYQGVNAYFDIDPYRNLHLFTNLNVESATYEQFLSQNPYLVNPVTGLSLVESFQGLPVSYVPAETWNTGANYTIERHDRPLVLPQFWFQFLGPQHIFDNCGLVNGACTTAQPSRLTMPSYETANLSLTVPFKFLSFQLDLQNMFDQKHNIYEYVSAGGYYGTSTAGYTFAYPGAPITVYGSVNFHF
jgi:iron complex outermembrane receptor protein